jgi:hypothetical protein
MSTTQFGYREAAAEASERRLARQGLAGAAQVNP